jgi:hypothetical protein
MKYNEIFQGLIFFYFYRRVYFLLFFIGGFYIFNWTVKSNIGKEKRTDEKDEGLLKRGAKKIVRVEIGSLRESESETSSKNPDEQWGIPRESESETSSENLDKQ